MRYEEQIRRPACHCKASYFRSERVFAKQLVAVRRRGRKLVQIVKVVECDEQMSVIYKFDTGPAAL